MKKKDFKIIDSDKGEFKIHSMKYNILMNVILKISAVIFPLITFPYISRVLHADAYGRVMFVCSVVSYYSIIASLGIPSYAVRRCASVRNNKYELSKTVKELLIINTVSLVLTYALFILSVLVVPQFAQDKILFYISSTSILLQTMGVEWFYQAIEQYDYITIRNLIFKVLFLILLFFLVKSKHDILIYTALNVFGTTGSNIINIIRLHRYVDLRLVKRVDLKHHLKPVFMLFFYYAATTIYTNLDSVMLGFISGNTEVGLYNAAIKIKTILVSIITALGSVSLPRISYYLAQNKLEEFKKIIKISFQCIVFLSIPLTAYFILEAYPVLQILAGDEYISAVDAMQAIMPSIVFIGLGSVTAWQLLIPMGKDKVTLIAAVAGALVDLMLNAIFIPKYGATGAAIGTLVAEIVVFTVQAINLKKIIIETFDFNNSIKVLISAIVALGGDILINYVSRNLNPIVVVTLTVFVFGILYILVCFVLKESFLMVNILPIIIRKRVRKHD